MTSFDADSLGILRDIPEVAIRTGKHPQAAVVIWLVVAEDRVFVRSARGAKGRWYRDIATGGAATLEFSGRRIAVTAVPVSDAGSIDAASAEYRRKYRSSPYAPSVARPEVLATTLRLQPA
ncbi:MAG TPA: DUF2255 family protein [Reyranella sp.]|nr:DUF2255 family protein [Reyranella sp.]